MTMKVCTKCGRIADWAEIKQGSGKCESCRKTYERNRSAARNQDGPYRRITTGGKWKQARTLALRRAGNTCQHRDRHCRGRLEVHHRTSIQDGGAPYDPDNLIVVCRYHHNAAEKTAGAARGSIL